MASEDQDILAKISQLAGQINKHKNQQPYERTEQTNFPTATSSYGVQPNNHGTRGNHGYHPYANNGWRPSRGSYRGTYSSRGYRGGRQPGIVRHRTLVLNGGTPTPPSQPDTGNVTPSSNENERPSSAGYITKTDRHLQLINKSYFEKDSQIRAKAIEDTRQQKLKLRDDREKLQLSRHLQRLGNSAGSSAVRSTGANNYEVNVDGIRFLVANSGSKLVKAPGDLHPANATPKTTVIGGVKFHRSKNGNMYRSGIIKATRRNAVVKINEPCKLFTTTGSCTKGPRCRYLHDPSKVGVCKDFLLKGSCPNGNSCDLSHDLTPERTPTCLHFAKGNCSNPDCRYTHVRVSPTSNVCRSFGIYGYCEKGATCTERHVHECPDYSNTGICTIKGCKLPHRLKASVIRRNAAAGDSPQGEDSSDVSSDEEAEIDSDDVDSDAIDEEFFGDNEGEEDLAVSNQQDYLDFRKP